MFATLIGPFPTADEDSGRSVAEDLAALGLEPVGDGFGGRVAEPELSPPLFMPAAETEAA